MRWRSPADVSDARLRPERGRPDRGPDLGGLHILVNNAGVTRDNLLFKMSDDDWDMAMGVHLRGAFLMTRAAQKHFVEQKYGAGHLPVERPPRSATAARPNYAAAKMGIQGFVRTLGIELGPFGVTANAIAPGFIATDMTDATAARVGMSVEDFRKAAAERNPVRRVGEAGDVAHVISFLVSEGAGFVSGQVIYVAGGPLCSEERPASRAHRLPGAKVMARCALRPCLLSTVSYAIDMKAQP